MKYLFLFLIFISQLAGTAQYVVRGSVTDTNGHPVEGMVMRLISTGGSIHPPYSTLSDQQGAFEFKLAAPGVYQLVCNSSFYRDTVISSIRVHEQQTLLPVLIVMPHAVSLRGIAVSARKKIFDSEAGKRIYYVSADPAAAGQSGIETINNIPGITATEEGPVLFRGSGEALLLINGRKVPGPPGPYLAQLASAVVERIEVSNNSTQFHAQGEGVIINIILKTAALHEWRAFFSTQSGYPLKQMTNFSILHSRKRSEFSFDIGGTLHHHPGQYSYERSTVNAGNTQLVSSSSRNSARHFTRKVQAGFTWKPDSSFTYSISVYIQRWPEKMQALFSRTVSSDGVISSELKNISRVSDTYDNSLVEVQQAVTKVFNRRWSASFNADISRSKEAQQATTYFSTAYSAIDFTRRRRAEVRTELQYSPANAVVLKAGLQSSATHADAGASYAEGPDEGDYTLTTAYTTRAAFLLGETRISPEFYIYPGLRYEYFSVAASVNGADQSKVQTTSGLFPTLIAGYKKGSNEVRFLIRRSIRRPGVLSLIPVSTLFSNKYDQAAVNLSVVPTFMTSYELSYSHAFKQAGRLDINFFTRFGQHEFEEIFQFSPGGNSQRKLQNTGSSRFLGFDVNYQVRYLKVFSSTFNVVLTKGKYDSHLFFNNQTLLAVADLNHSIFISPAVTARVRTQYYFKRKTIWGQNGAMAVAGVAVAWQLKDKRSTLTADISDLFRQSITRGTRYVPGGFETYRTVWDSRVARIGFTYRFGKLNKEVKVNLRGE